MRPLEALIAQAEAEVARVLQICNACRYCEGFCAVFPAMTRRLEFPAADVHYLANLCHGCGACLHACQYAPPHEFGVNVPRAMAAARRHTWRSFAWPRPFAALYERNALAAALLLALSFGLVLVLGAPSRGRWWGEVAGGDFYAVLPHATMVALFAPVFAFVLVALGVGVRRFWREQPTGTPDAGALGEATSNALTLRYLDGGHGQGCNEEDDAWTLARRRMHHLVFYGFLLCFAATAAGTVYHYALGWPAPYGFSTLPKLLGTAGGIGLVVGSAGLWRLHRRRHPLHRDPGGAAMDEAFIVLLFAVAASGLALVAARATAAMPLLLAAHLGAVLALFATMPYGKFAHGLYRAAALLKWAVERRRPNRLDLGSE